MKLAILKTEWNLTEQQKIKKNLEKTEVILLDSLENALLLQEPFLLFSSQVGCSHFCVKHHIPFLGLGLSLNCPYLVEDLDGLKDSYLKLVYSRFFHLPLTIYQSKDYIIREYSLEEFPIVTSLYRLFQNNNSVEPFPKEEAAALEQFSSRMLEYRYTNHGYWGIFNMRNDLIGQIGITSYENGLELSYMLHPDFQGKGIAFSLCKKVLAYGKNELGISSLDVRIRPSHTASMKLAKKLKAAGILNLQIIPLIK